jgi:hypothetical protein
MQTLEFTRALREILSELKVNELASVIRPWAAVGAPAQPITDDNRNQFSATLFASYSGFDRLQHSASAAKILGKLNVGQFYEAGRMRRMLTSVSTVANSQQLTNVPQNFADFYSFFQQLIEFTRLETTCQQLLEAEKIGQVEAEASILELQVIDYDGNGIEAVRLSKIIWTLTELHENLARILGIQNDKLRFKYFDSGSDLVIGITAATALIKILSPLLLQFWDKVRFRHHETFNKDIEALSKGLEFVTKVQDAVTNESITEEEGRNLKARVFSGVDDLIGLGATLPLKDTSVDQRQLLIEKRDTKLLGTGGGESSA